MTIRGTVCLIKKDKKILLMKKSKGLFGGGKWVVPGGKLRSGEDPGDLRYAQELGRRIAQIAKAMKGKSQIVSNIGR